MIEILPGQCSKKSQKVKSLDQISPELVQEMAELCKKKMGNYPGAIALAHCQVDHENPLRFFVFLSGEIIINPVIVAASGPFEHTEGCMSFPKVPTMKIMRYGHVVVEFTRMNGKKFKEGFSGLLACIFQHEIDHFNGKSIYSNL